MDVGRVRPWCWRVVGFLEGGPPFDGLQTGEACGPVGLGVYSEDAQACEFGALQGVVEESTAESEIVFVGGAETVTGRSRHRLHMDKSTRLWRAQRRLKSRLSLCLVRAPLPGLWKLVDGVALVGGLRWMGRDVPKLDRRL